MTDILLNILVFVGYTVGILIVLVIAGFGVVAVFDGTAFRRSQRSAYDECERGCERKKEEAFLYGYMMGGDDD